MQMSQSQRIQAKGMAAAGPGRSLPRDEGITSSGVSFFLWRLYQHFWLVCLLFPLVDVVTHPIAPWQVALRGTALLGFAAGYTWLMWPHPASQEIRARAHPRFACLLVGGLALLVLMFSLLYGPAWLWLFIGVSALVGMLFPLRSAFATIVLLTLLPLVLTLWMHGGWAGVDWWWLIAFVLLVRGIGLDMIGVARMGSAIQELHAARRELARLAVIDERERLARDLHDLLGQTLSMITLKSELARCLIEEDPERCARELSEIEHVSRQTLREVREAVAGYRQPTLVSELEGARQFLQVAGIDAQIDPIKEALPPALDAVLAWTVREGVTNVIRHSRARHCSVHLIQRNGTVGAEILNNGGERRQEEKPDRPGLGLAGLRERVSLLGGKLEAGPLLLQGKEHYRVCVKLPFPNKRETAPFQEGEL